MAAVRQSVDLVTFTAFSRNVLWDLHEIRLFFTKSEDSLQIFFPAKFSPKLFLAASYNCFAFTLVPLVIILLSSVIL